MKESRFRSNWRLYFEYVIYFSNQGSLLAGKTRQPYCLYCTRVTLISMEEDTSLVWRNAFYLDSLNSNDLPRHLISMEEDTLLVCRYLDSLNIKFT